MNMKKVISLVLAVALLLSCAPQILPVAEAVEIATPTVIYTVGDLGVTDAVIATSFENALGEIAAKNKQWEPDSVVEIQLDDGSYVFGASYAENLQGLVEGVNDKWATCSLEQKQGVLTMYETYEKIMKNWDIPAIIEAAK